MLPFQSNSPSDSQPDSQHILIVDDDVLNRELLQELLLELGYESQVAASGSEAIALLNPFTDLIMTDIQMPDMDGFALIERVRERPEYENLPIIVVTAFSSKEERLRAVETGANDFLAKPIDRTELRVRVRSLVKLCEIQKKEKRYRDELELEVGRRTGALHRALEFMADAEGKAHEAHLETVRRLAIAAEYRDENTAAHVFRVGKYCALLAEYLKLPQHEVDLLRDAASMHDVGKIGTPDSILLKPGKLTPEERRIMEFHTHIGARILGNSNSELLEAGEQIAMTHHERWDGTGYPYGLKGADIPLYGRICAVADVFDALMSSRPYKVAFTFETARGIMEEGRGSHFDPDFLDLFLLHFDEFIAIHEQHPDAHHSLLFSHNHAA